MVKKVSGAPSTAVDFDALLPHIGEFGPYQATFYLLMCVPTMPAAFLAFNQVRVGSRLGGHFQHTRKKICCVVVSDCDNQSL